MIQVFVIYIQRQAYDSMERKSAESCQLGLISSSLHISYSSVYLIYSNFFCVQLLSVFGVDIVAGKRADNSQRQVGATWTITSRMHQKIPNAINDNQLAIQSLISCQLNTNQCTQTMIGFHNQLMWQQPNFKDIPSNPCNLLFYFYTKQM